VTSVFCFAEDLIGEGIPTVLDRIQDAGADSVTLAATYHAARDVFPHHPGGSIQYLASGSSAFLPDPGRYDVLAPKAGPVTGGRDLLAELVTAATRRGISASAWAVILHSSRLGRAHPEVTIENALGDRLLHALCPAHPEVRSYAVALSTELAEHGVQTVRLEALTAGGFDHGETHERALIHLGETARFLLGLCFCTYCRTAGDAAGIDAGRLAARVQQVLREVLRAHAYEASLPPLSREALAELVGADLMVYLQARERSVTTLAAAINLAVRSVSPASRLVLLDPSGAALGYATGRPETGEPATAIGWREGLDLPALSEHADVGVLAYFADPHRTAREIASYEALLDRGARLDVILRPTWPDVTNAEDLIAKVAAVRTAKLSELNFYTYGLLRLESFDWIRQALSIAEKGTRRRG